MNLSELLNETKDFSQPHPWGGVQVFPSDRTRPRYWETTDHKVVASLSGPSLHLMPSDNPAAIVGAFLSY